MWHEARKQEKLIRGLIVDYRRRAERRKDFYEKIKAEPTQFLQLHGRPCKIHLDPAVAAAGDSPAIMMPWQGDSNNMIDRFDVRAHLDYIPEIKVPELQPEDLEQEERHCNYERYRILAQNSFLAISEDKFLQQLAIEEQFGVTIEEKEAQKEKLNEKKGGVAIGYNYNDPGSQPSTSIGHEAKPKPQQKEQKEKNDSDDDSDLEVIDVDLSIDVNKMEAPQAHELNAVGPQYGMAGCDLFSFLTGDADDAEHQKQVMREEKEKAMFSGRKSRRERRAHRDKKLVSRVLSPPSYAARPAPAPPRRAPDSASPSPPPEPAVAGAGADQCAIQFITSFGAEDDERPPPPLPKSSLYSEKLKHNLTKVETYSEVARKPKARSRSSSSERAGYRRMGPHRPKSRTNSRSRSRSYSCSRSRSRSPRRWSNSSSSRSRSRSRSQYRRTRSRSRSRSRNCRRRSRSPENHSKRYDNTSHSRESNDRGAAPAAVPRYYGRRKEDKSSSELDLDSDDSDDNTNQTPVGSKSNSNQNQLRLTGPSSKGSSRVGAMSLKDKLKKKMQAQLSRQLRADKKAEAERLDREERRQARRDQEMRDLAIKLRRKQREMRHQQRRSSDDSDRSCSGSSSREHSPTRDKLKPKSESKSPSPQERRIPVWVSGDAARRVPPGEDIALRRRSDHETCGGDRQGEQEHRYNTQRQYEERPNKPYEERPSRPYEERPNRPYEDRPHRPYEERTPRPYEERPHRPYEERPPRSYEERPPRSYEERPTRPYEDRSTRPYEERPPRPYEERPPRSYEERPPRPYEERPPRPFEERPPRPYEERPRHFAPRPDNDRNYDNRWRDDRRTYRGGYKGDSRRYPEGSGDGPSSWQEEDKGLPGTHNKNKVKLVDY